MKHCPKTLRELKALVNDENISLKDIDTSSIVTMQNLFAYSTRKNFNGIEDWDVSNVKDMESIFEGITLNADLSKWDVSNVEVFHFAFNKCNFNGNIENWNLTNAVTTRHMFHDSTFNGKINWDLSNVKLTQDMFKNCPLEKVYKWKI